MRDLPLVSALLLSIGWILACLLFTVLYIVGWLVKTRGWRGEWKFFWLIRPSVGQAYLALVFGPPGLFLLAWLSVRGPR